MRARPHLVADDSGVYVTLNHGGFGDGFVIKTL
jgi:hypothetical protein